MAEYTKLSSEDTGSYGITKFLNENIPFGKKPFLPTKFKKEEKSDKLELIDFGYKNQASNPYTNKYSSLSLSINRKTQENINRNRARNGNMKMLLYNKENEPAIVLGPEWPSSLIMIIFLILFIVSYFHFFKNSINPTIKFYGIIISFIHIILYLICFLINPGIPPKNLWIENYFKNKNNDSNKNYSIKICKDCKIIIENTEHIEHCKICNLCIIDMMHHSFWIGKCIGKKNKYYYYCFLFMTVILGVCLIFSFISILLYKKNNIQE